MIQHVVAFRLAEMPEAQEAALLAAFNGLMGVIPELKAFSMGRNISDRDQTYTHCLISVMDDMDAVGRYLKHPAHEAAVETHLKPVMEARAVMDYVVG